MVFLILNDRVYVNNFITYGIACCVTHFNVQIIYEQKVQKCDATKVKCLFNNQAYKKLHTYIDLLFVKNISKEPIKENDANRI